MCGEFCTLPALFLKIIFNVSFFATPWLVCLVTLSIGVYAPNLTNRVVVQKQRVDLN